MSSRIQDLHPLVQEKLKELRSLAKEQGIEFKVTHTLRTKAEQDALYAQGRTKPGKVVTNAKYPYSFHNHGVAFDVVPLVEGKPDYSAIALFNRLGKIGKSVGLEWGGDWKGLVDRPHFQFTQGKKIEAFVNGYSLDSEIQKQEGRLAAKMAIAEDALEEANAERAILCRLKGMKIRRYEIKDGPL